MGKLDLNKFKFLCEYGFKVDNKLNEEDDEIDLGELEDEIMGDEPIESTEDIAPIENEESFADNSDENVGNEEEIDVTVDNGELEIDLSPIEDKAQEALDKTEGISELMAKFEELQAYLGKMDDISEKIDSLEKEIEVRNPTPIEKMEIRSLNAFPYNQTLSNFWDEKEGYEVSADFEEEEKYTLSNDDIKDDYDADKIKKSFNVK